MVVVSIATIGTERFVRGFAGLESRMQDLREPFGEISVDLADMVTENFAVAGKPEKWAPLSPEYAAHKARVRPGAPMLVFDGELYESLRGIRDEGGRVGTVRQIYPKRAEFGTIVPHAIWHQRGTSRGLPRRKVIQLEEADKRRWGRILHEWAVKGLDWIRSQRGRIK